LTVASDYRHTPFANREPPVTINEWKFDADTGLLTKRDRLGEIPIAHITSAGNGHVIDTGRRIAALLTSAERTEAPAPPSKGTPQPIPIYVISRPSGYVVQISDLERLASWKGRALALAYAIAEAIAMHTTQTADVVVVTE
jgi:hypothetical protein